MEHSDVCLGAVDAGVRLEIGQEPLVILLPGEHTTLVSLVEVVPPIAEIVCPPIKTPACKTDGPATR